MLMALIRIPKSIIRSLFSVAVTACVWLFATAQDVYAAITYTVTDLGLGEVRLEIDGDSLANTISVGVSDGDIFIYDGSSSVTVVDDDEIPVAPEDVVELIVQGKGGGDSINIEDVNTANGFDDFLLFPELHGNAGSDTIEGSSDLDDCIFGGDDNDSLLGHGGEDVIQGGSGPDLLFGGAGDDQLYHNFRGIGQEDPDGYQDLLNGDAGADDVIGNTSSDGDVLNP